MSASDRVACSLLGRLGFYSLPVNRKRVNDMSCALRSFFTCSRRSFRPRIVAQWSFRPPDRVNRRDARQLPTTAGYCQAVAPEFDVSAIDHDQYGRTVAALYLSYLAPAPKTGFLAIVAT
jgi:hypothetical protein